MAILDADKEGFLRSTTSLIQTIGRAARNVSGEVHMYADKVTDSMQNAIDETERRREKQIAYNKEVTLIRSRCGKKIADILDQVYREADDEVSVGGSGRNATRGRRAQGDNPEGFDQCGRHRAPGCVGHAARRVGGSDRPAHRSDDVGGLRPAVRARWPVARRDRRFEEGTTRNGRRRYQVDTRANETCAAPNPIVCQAQLW